MKTQSVMLPVGRELAAISRYWRPATHLTECLACGERHYHIMQHIAEKHPNHQTEINSNTREEDVWASCVPSTFGPGSCSA